jgi:hypothetical protein
MYYILAVNFGETSANKVQAPARRHYVYESSRDKDNVIHLGNQRQSSFANRKLPAKMVLTTQRVKRGSRYRQNIWQSAAKSKIGKGLTKSYKEGYDDRDYLSDSVGRGDSEEFASPCWGRIKFQTHLPLST